MHVFTRKFITEWRRLGLAHQGETVVIAVSGGADSLSLLLAMHRLVEAGKLNLRIVAAHFNHGLRGNDSNRDEDFVRKLTGELRIEFACGRAKPQTRGNLEQNARDARYSFFSELSERVGAFAVLTGHTINDQAETFLMNLIRGSGRDGLSGMKPIRVLDNGCQLARPMLTWAKRGDTEQFCRDLGVEYCCDTMNEDTAFKRVRIRKILLPLLEDFNPNIVEILANTAFLLSNDSVNTTEKNQNEPTDELAIRDLKGLDESQRLVAIREWLTHKRGNARRLGLKHIGAVSRLALSTKSGHAAEIPGGRVLKTDGRLRYEANKVEKKGSDN